VKYRCDAAGCALFSKRALPPPACTDTRRCVWVLVTEESPQATNSEEPEPLTLTIEEEVHSIVATTVLGRNGLVAQELFRTDLSISREHCRLEREGSDWYLTALSHSSPTLLDGKQLAPLERRMLPPGESIVTLGAGLIVRVRFPTRAPHESTTPAADAPEAEGELARLLRTGADP
jgi:pSer/pThr/pTyr-binding forkhead associated (FHA) protein